MEEFEKKIGKNMQDILRNGVIIMDDEPNYDIS